ncbi:MAG: TIM barrel protein [Thermoguttaceae bacterium]|jgi:sugar phosphate isomerase/epimerase
MFKNLSPTALGVTGHQSELIELALTYGFGGMDLNVTDFATRARLKGMPYARRLFDSAKIRLGTFQLPVDWDADEETYQKDLKKLPDYAQAAAAVGCTRAAITLLPAGDKRPYHENFEFHRRRFQEICKALEPSGVRLGVAFQAAEYLRKNQAFQFIHDLDALMLLVNMAAAPNIGLVLDLWDIVASGGSLDSVRKIDPAQIVAVQMADMPAGVAPSDLDEKSRLLPGTDGGRLDLVTLLVYLKEIGYDGPVTPKPSRGVLPSRRRDVVVKQVGEAMEKIWRAAGLPSERRFVASSSASDYHFE